MPHGKDENCAGRALRVLRRKWPRDERAGDQTGMRAAVRSAGNESKGFVPRARQEVDVGLLFGAWTRQLAVNEGSVTGAILAHMAAHANLSPTRALPLLDQALVLFNCGASLSQSGCFACCTILAAYTLAPPPHDQRTSASQLPACSLRLFYRPRPAPRSSDFLLTSSHSSHPKHAFARCCHKHCTILTIAHSGARKNKIITKERKIGLSSECHRLLFSHNAKSQPRTRSPHQVLPSRSLSQHFVFFHSWNRTALYEIMF